MVHGDAFQMGSVYSGGSDDSDSDSGMGYDKSEKAAMMAAMHGMGHGMGNGMGNGSIFGTPHKSNRSEFGTNMSRGTSVAKESYMEDDVLLNDVDEGESQFRVSNTQGLAQFEAWGAGAGVRGELSALSRALIPQPPARRAHHTRRTGR